MIYNKKYLKGVPIIAAGTVELFTTFDFQVTTLMYCLHNGSVVHHTWVLPFSQHYINKHFFRQGANNFEADNVFISVTDKLGESDFN